MQKLKKKVYLLQFYYSILLKSNVINLDGQINFIMVNNICATSYKNRIQLFKNLFLDFQFEVCFSKPFNLCSGWISVRLWVAGWLDDGYGSQAQR